MEDCTGQTIRDVRLQVNSGGTGIAVTNQTLNYSVIDVLINGGSAGVDLKEGSTGRIGIHNVIHVRTGVVRPTTIVDLPTGWSTTPKNTTNDVQINGVRYYPPTDEF